MNFKGFFEKEIIKDKLIPIAEPPEKIDAPKPKEIIDIEVDLIQCLTFWT